MNETGEEKKTNRTNATPRGAEKEGGSRRTRANDREGAGRAPVRDRRTEGRERRRKDRGGARGAGDAATFSLYIRGATHSDHPGAPSSSFYTVAHESQSLSRGKKIHPGVTWRIRKLPTCDATKNSDARTTTRSARPRPSPPVAEAYGPARLLEKPPGSPCLPSPAPPRRCVPGRRSGPCASRTPRRARAEARRARGGKRTTPGCAPQIRASVGRLTTPSPTAPSFTRRWSAPRASPPRAAPRTTASP
jgi:hypothetical protein